MKTGGTKTLRSALLVAVLLYGEACAILYAMQDRLIYPGAYEPVPSWVAQAVPLSYERVTIPVSDGVDLYALYRAPQSGKPTVVVFHGNGGYPEDYVFLYKAWAASGYGIVAPAYRGYPRSSGTVSGDGILRDALDVYDWTHKRHPDSPVVVFGQSLGAASAVHVAASREVSGVVLVSPFLSMLSVAGDRLPVFPVASLLSSPFRSDLDMPSVKAPVLVFHGDADTTVPIASGRALAALSKTPPDFETVRGAGHTEGLFDGTMVRAIIRFISGLRREG